MKKSLLLLLSIFVICFAGHAQEKVKRFHFAGYRVVFVPSATFRVEVKHPEWGNQKIKDGILSLAVKDRDGRMPKDTVYIYTDSVRSISMEYSELKIDEQLSADSLRIVMSAGSYGTINVKANYLSVSAGAGSHVKVKGKTRDWECHTNGHSSVDADLLEKENVSTGIRNR